MDTGPIVSDCGWIYYNMWWDVKTVLEVLAPECVHTVKVDVSTVCCVPSVGIFSLMDLCLKNNHICATGNFVFRSDPLNTPTQWQHHMESQLCNNRQGWRCRQSILSMGDDSEILRFGESSTVSVRAALSSLLKIQPHPSNSETCTGGGSTTSESLTPLWILFFWNHWMFLLPEGYDTWFSLQHHCI